MSSKKTIQRIVRQRARFKCEACGHFTDAQYAHIIPEVENGPFSPSNILFLCYEDHRKFEVAHLNNNSNLRKQLITKMRQIQRSTKQDSPLQKFLEYNSERLICKIGNNVFRSKKIFYTKSLPELDLLTLEVNNGKLILNCLFFDNEKLILSIHNNLFETHSNTLFDIIISINGKMRLISKNKLMDITLEQDGNGVLNITGTIFYYGLKYTLSKAEGLTCRQGTFKNCSFIGPGFCISQNGIESI